MEIIDLKRVYTLFLVGQENPQVVLIQRPGKEGLRLPQTKIQDRDAFSSSLAAARSIVTKIGNLDLRSLEDGESYQNLINWDALTECQKQWDLEEKIEFTSLLRNPFKLMIEKLLTSSPLWNDNSENNFIYFVYISEDQLKLFKNQVLDGVQLITVPVSELIKQNLSKSSKFFIEQFNLKELLELKPFLEIKTTFIYIGFKLSGFDKWSPPRPFLHTYAIFEGLYRRRNEEWLQFNAPDNDLPNEEQLQRAQAILLSGSSCSSYDDYEWIRNTEKFLYNAYQNHKHLKFLGICFGLQILVQSFGGKVEPVPKRRDNKMFYMVGNEELENDVDTLQKVRGLENLFLKKYSIINKAHGDEVTIYPEDLFVNVGTSKACRNEALLSRDHRILGFQGHPEYSTDQQKFGLTIMRSFFTKKSVSELLKDPQIFANWSKGMNDPIHRAICLNFIKTPVV